MASSNTSTQVNTTTLQQANAELPTFSLHPRRPEQKPFTVTLSNRSLTVAALGLAILSHHRTLHLARLLLVFVPLALFVHNDYQNFLRLGPGGIPSTPQGYLKASWLSIWALKNPYEPAPAVPHYTCSPGLLRKATLPERNDPRPTTAGIAPHRQITQYGSTQCFQALTRALQAFASMNPSEFETRVSALEKHGLALFSRKPTRQNRFQGEICHVHDTDHSLHLFLHPDDVKVVLEQGWGERHPMAWEWGPWKPAVGPFFVMIYAPRSENELRIVAKIIEAAAWNMSGRTVHLSSCLPAL
ncbi:hypothetical protein NLU13_2100 [Sarocladium strictum]|uniref:Luciferase domain-containing protein n=1 Tax=Sarocladium strictum TaxID=5046 RepID=A0AA39GS68_SARSR|nr:hypothetical protein NLU13_2100 [Sarocladium strictum]